MSENKKMMLDGVEYLLVPTERGEDIVEDLDTDRESATRVAKGETFFSINNYQEPVQFVDERISADDALLRVGNYYKNRAEAELDGKWNSLRRRMALYALDNEMPIVDVLSGKVRYSIVLTKDSEAKAMFGIVPSRTYFSCNNVGFEKEEDAQTVMGYFYKELDNILQLIEHVYKKED